MSIADSVIFPVIATDKSGCIIYKNRAARRCIPSPRAGGNLHKYINILHTCRQENSEVGIVFIENAVSIFKRAFVLYGEDRDTWLFLSELQLSEPESIAEIPASSLKVFADSVSRLMLENIDTADESSPLRYHRAEEEMLRALKQINTDKNSSPFRISDILSSLAETTRRLSSALNFRVKFNFDIRDSKMGYRIRFTPFAMIYTYILIFLLRGSRNGECYIDAIRVEDVIKFSFRTTVSVSGITKAQSNDFSQLASLFPKDQINLMLTTQSAALNEFKISWDLSDSGELALNLTVSLNNTSGTFLFQPPPATVVTREFRRRNKRVLEYLESILAQYKN